MRFRNQQEQNGYEMVGKIYLSKKMGEKRDLRLIFYFDLLSEI